MSTQSVSHWIPQNPLVLYSKNGTLVAGVGAERAVLTTQLVDNRIPRNPDHHFRVSSAGIECLLLESYVHQKDTLIIIVSYSAASENRTYFRIRFMGSCHSMRRKDWILVSVYVYLKSVYVIDFSSGK